MSLNLPIFTSTDLLEEAAEEKINELVTTAKPIHITQDAELQTRGYYRDLAIALCEYGASRAGLMNDVSCVLDAPAHPKIYQFRKNRCSGIFEWMEIVVNGDMYYEVYGYSDQTWSWNTDAKRFAREVPPIPADKLIPRFRILDLFFQLIGSPVRL